MGSGPLNLRDLDDPDFSYESASGIFLFTSLTAGSSHIITATKRLETILKANRIAFQAVDVATDEKARRLWGRRAGKKKLPGLVREGYVLADLEQVEEWNEYGEIKQELGGAAAAPAAAPVSAVKPVVPQPPPQPLKDAASTEPAASPTPPSAQQLAHQAQHSLAAEAAAAATARKQAKLKALKEELAADSRASPKEPAESAEPAAESQKEPAEPSAESQKEPAEPAAESQSQKKPDSELAAKQDAPVAENDDAAPRRIASRSPEGHADYDMTGEHPMHSISAHAGLPPLAIRTRPLPDADAGLDGVKSPSMPSVPPPTAIEEKSPPIDFTSALNKLQEVKEDEEEEDALNAETEATASTSIGAVDKEDNAAAPASKSGLAAVTDDPKAHQDEFEAAVDEKAAAKAESQAEPAPTPSEGAVESTSVATSPPAVLSAVTQPVEAAVGIDAELAASTSDLPVPQHVTFEDDGDREGLRDENIPPSTVKGDDTSSKQEGAAAAAADETAATDSVAD